MSVVSGRFWTIQALALAQTADGPSLGLFHVAWAIIEAFQEDLVVQMHRRLGYPGDLQHTYAQRCKTVGLEHLAANNPMGKLSGVVPENLPPRKAIRKMSFEGERAIRNSDDRGLFFRKKKMDA